MPYTTVDPAELRAGLVDKLTATGHLTDPRWRNAFAAVPRELFVTRFSVPTPDGLVEHDLSTPAQQPAALAAVYTDTTLITQQDAGGTATSSSTTPSLMALMLHQLDAQPGHQVLEIGAGTGYNAALLSHALGQDAVTTIDIDPVLVDSARRSLRRAGYAPTVLLGDGATHVRSDMFDRLIATCGVDRVPPSWLAQVRPGGVVLANVGFGLVRLTVDSDGSAHGPVVDYSAFMSLRRTPSDTEVTATEILEWASGRTAESRPVTARTALRELPVTFLRSLIMPGVAQVIAHHQTDTEHVLAHPASGSWARARTQRDGRGQVTTHGPRDLWEELHTVTADWAALGRPEPSSYTLTVNASGEHTLATAAGDWATRLPH